MEVRRGLIIPQRQTNELYCIEVLIRHAIHRSHLGDTVAKYCGDHLHRHIFADPAFGEKVFKTAIRNGFLETDRALNLDPDCNSESSGCTAITATITDKNILYVVGTRPRDLDATY